MKHLNRFQILHNRSLGWRNSLRDIIFGLEDGMVSTLGALTGIAIGSQNRDMIVLAGLVIIAVESVSMGIGSFMSSRSVIAIDKRRLSEEAKEVKYETKKEVQELNRMYIAEGWPKTLAKQMSQAAGKNSQILLKEMAVRELYLVPEKKESAWRNGLFMFFSYVIGGLIPVLVYWFFPIQLAITLSIILTLIALFILGVATSYFTKLGWWRSGWEMLLLAGLAAIIGYLVGSFFS
ncbi:MAG: VIT1/CCC1 transporter family protein [bacterium]